MTSKFQVHRVGRARAGSWVVVAYVQALGFSTYVPVEHPLLKEREAQALCRGLNEAYEEWKRGRNTLQKVAGKVL